MAPSRALVKEGSTSVNVIDPFLAISSLLFNLGQGAVWTFIRIQIYDLQGSFFEIMLISSIPSLFGFLFSGVWGSLSDIKVSKKHMIIFGYLTTSIITLFLLLTKTTTELIFVYSVMAFFGVSYIPALNALISSVEGGKQGARVGWYTTIFSLGFTLGSFVGGYLAHVYGYNSVYLVSGIVGIVGSLFMFGYKDYRVIAKRSGGGFKEIISSLSIAKMETPMKLLVLAHSIQTFAGATFYNLYTLIYYEILNKNKVLYGIFNGIAGLGSIIAPRLYGGAIDKFDSKKIYMATSFIYTPYFVALTYFRNIYMVTFLWFLPLWPGVYLPAIALATRFSGEDKSGTYQGILNSYASLSRTFGPLIGGLIADSLGARQNINSLNIFLYIIAILPILSATIVNKIRA